ncbi:hypothetical protein [Vibrio phage vB_VhaS-tm]|nr:hypothetical protein [Vibrio phage vB_VhaS-tm]
MAKVTTTICDNCGVEITEENDSRSLVRLVYPSEQHEGFEALESNDICQACYAKVQSAVLQALKPEAFTCHMDAASIYLDN